MVVSVVSIRSVLWSEVRGAYRSRAQLTYRPAEPARSEQVAPLPTSQRPRPPPPPHPPPPPRPPPPSPPEVAAAGLAGVLPTSLCYAQRSTSSRFHAVQRSRQRWRFD